MSAKAAIIAVAGVTLALALALGWRASRSALAARASLEAVETKQAAANAAVRRMQGQIASADGDWTKLQAMFKDLRAREIFSAARFGASNRPDPFLTLEADPKLLALGARAYRASVDRRFGLLCQILGLAPAQIAKWEDLKTAHYEDGIDLAATARLEGLEDSAPAIAALRQQQDDGSRAAQIALLGGDAYRQLDQFDRAQPARDIATNAATSVALSSSPMSWAQTEQVTQWLANASGSYQSGGPVDPAAIDWDAVLTQAQESLSPPQFSALRAEYQRLQLEAFHTQFNRRESAK